MFAFTFRWSTALILAFFWCYGYFGALTHPKELSSFPNQIALSLSLAGAFFWMVLKRDVSPLRTIKIEAEDLGAWLFYFALALLLMAGELAHYPTADQAYHAERAQLHGLVAVLSVGAFNDWPMRQALHLISYFAAVAAMASVWLLSRIKNRTLQAAVAAGLFLVVRLALAKSGGYSDPHPPLRLLPLWFSSSVFGITAFAFRLPTLLALTLLGAGLFKKHKDTLGSGTALLLGLAAITFPTVLLTSTFVEASLWTALAWTGALFALEKSETTSFPFAEGAALAALATLMRQPSIALFGMLAVFSAVAHGLSFRKILGDKQSKFLLAAACLTVGPFFLRTLAFGTPTTGLKNDAGENPARAWLFEALRDGRPLKVFAKDFGYLMLLPLLLAIYPSRDGAKNRRPQWLAALSLFGLGILMFFSIPPALQGNTRYQTEYFFPFLVLGLSRLATHPRIKAFSFWVLAAAVAINLHGILRLQDRNATMHHTYDGSFDSPTRYVYPYEKALSELRFAEGETYLDEALYGAFPLVLSGSTVNSVRSSQEILRELWKSPQKWVMSCSEKITGQAIHGVSKIQVALLQNGHPAINELERLGWSRVKTFTDETYGAKLVALARGSK